jgi:hypothetical protein
MLSAAELATLNSLTWHWEGAYAISVQDGAWLAVPLSDPSVLPAVNVSHDVMTAADPFDFPAVLG